MPRVRRASSRGDNGGYLGGCCRERQVRVVTHTGLATPPCAICGQWRQGQRARRHLTHGVSVWLCDTHRGDGYTHRSGGREFVERLTAVWAASDALTNVRRNALRAHLRAVGDAPPSRRELPGSYSWPALRREAERRFAAGEAPNEVIADLRTTYADGPSVVPSLRTMRRWFTQARWLTRGSDPATPQERPVRRHGPLTPREQFVNLMLTGYGNWPRRDAQLVRGP